jgi:hypothetical protein
MSWSDELNNNSPPGGGWWLMACVVASSPVYISLNVASRDEEVSVLCDNIMKLGSAPLTSGWYMQCPLPPCLCSLHLTSVDARWFKKKHYHTSDIFVLYRTSCYQLSLPYKLLLWSLATIIILTSIDKCMVFCWLSGNLDPSTLLYCQ